MRTVVQSLLLPLSLLILAGSVVMGVALIASRAQGGFFPGLGLALGILLLGAGNCLSCLLNTVIWGSGYRPRWLGALLAVQALPALLFAGWAASELWETRAENVASAQRGAILDAIASDDLPALLTAQAGCGERCTARTRAGDDLLAAADYGARNAARHLIGQGAVVGRGNWYGAQMSLRTCEGSYLPLLMALSVAVAREDEEMARLLLPVSDEAARSEALRTAAELDRLDFVRFLSAAGVPLNTREQGGTGERHLLVAAAGGAAMHVGGWLLEERPVPVGKADLQAATGALFRFMEETGVPRSLDFARMLVANGADIDAPFRDEPSFLDEAVRTGRKDVTTMLLSAGADASRLSADRTAALNTLRQEPDRPAYDRRTEGCVRVGG
ncbi:ankyrin repeat domain-containing protein [Rhizobiaceae bacterium BDR2-2]|uniref:Ankyrin repeat domain-containing protein n=1 Tax=Ectorhizobium quercum TaxID=2965071 RepID=A0AAE3N3R8_9HYPH|nr:hypothetical protein [Ectorhizobium quercum]MCX8999391.1 ankyrin repeat domain-containing protein [Ectorhizobium quercum]